LAVVVDDVINGKGRGRGLIPRLLPAASDPQVLLGVAVGALLVIVLVAAVADYFSTVLMETAAQRIGNDIRAKAFAHLQRLSLQYHTEHTVGDLAARVTSDVDRVQDLLVQALSVLAPSALLIAGMAAVMVAVDPGFSLLALLVAPLLVRGVYVSTRNMKVASRQARNADGRVASAANESLAAIQVVQAFGLEAYSQDQFEEMNRESLEANLVAARSQARLGPIVDLSAAASTGLILWFGAERVLSGRLSLGVLLVFITYLASLYKPVKALAKLSYVVSRGAASGERVESVLSATPDIADLPGAVPAPPLRGAVEFVDVSFSYGREPVLVGVDLIVHPGEVVALVGPTGAGKSTLAALIPRFFDVDTGEVRLDGRDVRDYQVASVRAQIAVVLQDSVLFRGTLADNIACARPGASPDDVRSAASLAQLDEFTDRLPDGLATVIAERGASLSGGQRQRVAIARAILRNAPILILDEPTSALDAASESLVIEGLHNLMRGRSTIVIAHRLSTVRRADRIVVLDHGRVVQQGRHDELTGARRRRLQACPVRRQPLRANPSSPRPVGKRREGGSRRRPRPPTPPQTAARRPPAALSPFAFRCPAPTNPANRTFSAIDRGQPYARTGSNHSWLPYTTTTS